MPGAPTSRAKASHERSLNGSIDAQVLRPCSSLAPSLSLLPALSFLALRDPPKFSAHPISLSEVYALRNLLRRIQQPDQLCLPPDKYLYYVYLQVSSLQSTPSNSMRIENTVVRGGEGSGVRERDNSSRGKCPACEKDVLGLQERVKVMQSQKDAVPVLANSDEHI